MVRRRLLVQVLLGALLVSALAGVVAVFMPAATGAGRLAGSAGVVVLACALLMPLSRPTEGSRPSMAAIAWLTLVLGALALVLVNIWELAPPGTPRTVATTLMLAWCGYGVPVAILLLTALRKVGAGSGVRHPAAVACAVIGATISFTGALSMEVHGALSRPSLADWSFVPSAFLFTMVASVTGAANLVPFRRPALSDRRSRVAKAVGTLGFTCTLVALALAYVLLELSMHAPRHPGSGPLLVQLSPWCVALSGAAISAATWGPVSSLGFRGWAAWLAPVATSVTVAITVLLTIVAVDDTRFDPSSSLLLRSVYALGIVDASALVMVALLARFRRSDSGTHDFLKPVSGLDLKCPRCAVPRFAALGESACRGCGLVLLLAVRDDACPGCGYDLRHAQAGACPECGRARQVPAQA